MTNRVFFLLFFFNFSFASLISGQDSLSIIKGKVTDEFGNPLEGVNIGIAGIPGGTNTNKNGNFELILKPGLHNIGFSFVGLDASEIKIEIKRGEIITIDPVKLKRGTKILKNIEITDEETRRTSLTRINPKLVSALPNASGSFETILKTLPGVSSNNELSSQYSVRGGNYDENLVYVNDIEIYRPFLARSGQQEGLSFINSELVSSILFSAGGFEAKYGDKMSSVLDIQYRKPTKFAASASGSLLGGGAHLEGATEGYRLTYLIGFRQRTNTYLLGALDTKGEYKPSFTDIQGVITYDLTPELELNILGNYARNKYNVVPVTRKTDFGTVNEALRLTVYFDGQEVDDFETTVGAFSFIYRPKSNLTLKFIGSGYQSFENETFDIQGQYYLDELGNDFGKPDFGKVVFNRGVGTFLNHARNNLQSNVINIEHKGILKKEKHFINWGLRAQHEEIKDKLSEWTMLDSADYSIPIQNDEVIRLFSVIKSTNNIKSERYSGFLQNSIKPFSEKDLVLTAGIRSSFWTLNKQLVFSPRFTLSYKPETSADILFRGSAGYYHQPPFYRELRDLNGAIHPEIQAQQSIHFVLGGDYNFKAWNRPFKFVSELYYKKLDRLVPYEIDNVRIRYYANNNARGYSTGVDLKINGEFVKGIESWFSMSVMKSEEDISNDFFYDYYNAEGEKIIKGVTLNQIVSDSIKRVPGYIPRPMDQRVNFNLFFQDYLPRLPDFKMHLNLVFGTGFPFGPPDFKRYKDTLRFSPYRRVDIGFSYKLLDREKEIISRGFLKIFKSIWISAEVFNLLQVDNTVSYLWIRDVSNRQYAVPNYLTARQLNARLVMQF